MADVSRICEELGEELTDEELAELARELGDHLGFGSARHESESAARDRFEVGRDRRRARDGESELRNGYSPVFGHEIGRRDVASFMATEGRNHLERDRALRDADARERMGDYGGAADARRRAAWHAKRADDRRRARMGRDEPAPFPGRPRPGGEMDPVEDSVRRRIRAVMDSPEAAEMARRHPEAARDFRRLKQALASDSRPITGSSDFNIRYANTSLVGNKIKVDHGPTSPGAL